MALRARAWWLQAPGGIGRFGRLGDHGGVIKEPLGGGNNGLEVVRVGDTVRRARDAGSGFAARVLAASACYAADQLVPFQCRIWLLLLWSGTSADRLNDPTAQQSVRDGQAIAKRLLFDRLTVPPGLAV